MTTISSSTSAERRITDEADKAQKVEQDLKRELDPAVIRVAHSASDVATFAKNLAARAVSGATHVATVAATEGSTIGRGHLDSHAAASRTFASVADARNAFVAQSGALLDVASWTKISGRENAKFDLYDDHGMQQAARLPTVGDFVRIQLPGQSKADWVRIEAITVDPDHTAIRVRPSFDPTQRPLTPSVTAHFFSSAATNTFIVDRSGTTVSARVEGRDESANVGAGSGGPFNAIRNRVVAETAWGAQRDLPRSDLQVNGMQQHQWNRFTQNIVDIKP